MVSFIILCLFYLLVQKHFNHALIFLTMIIEHIQIFWPGSKVIFYVQIFMFENGRKYFHIQKILNTVKHLERIQIFFWTSRWIRHKKSSFSKLLSFFVCQFLLWEKVCENLEIFFSQNPNPSTKRVKTHYQNWHPNLPIIAEDVKKYKCYQCIDFFFLQEELDCHLNLQHGVKTDKNYCKRQGYLLGVLTTVPVPLDLWLVQGPGQHFQ